MLKCIVTDKDDTTVYLQLGRVGKQVIEIGLLIVGKEWKRWMKNFLEQQKISSIEKQKRIHPVFAIQILHAWYVEYISNLHLKEIKGLLRYLTAL